MTLHPKKPRARLVGPAFRRGYECLLPIRIQHALNIQPAGVTPNGELVSSTAIRETLLGAFDKRWGTSGQATLRPEPDFDDGTYYCPNLAEVDDVISTRQFGKIRGRAELFDCEDFSYLLRTEFALHRYIAATPNTFCSFAFGIAWTINEGGGRHVLNVLVSAGQQVHLLDGTPGADALRPTPIANWKGQIRYIVI